MSTSMQRIVELDLQRRNPETGEIITAVERADARRIGVVVMVGWGLATLCAKPRHE